MCKFFSFVSDGNSNFMYFDWELRKKCMSGELKYEPDSHTSIAEHFGFKGKREDGLNKYEYNPLTKKFVVDQLNAKNHDDKEAEKWVRGLDFATIVPQLVIKDIVHPFTIHNDVTQEDIDNLKEWASVGASVSASVMASVWDLVWASVGDSVCASAGDSVWASVGASVWDSVWDSVWASVGASVRASVGASVRASVGAYYSSFFSIEYKHDYSSLNKLWNRGFVPSFDGTTWRLHSGRKAKIVYEWRK